MRTSICTTGIEPSVHCIEQSSTGSSHGVVLQEKSAVAEHASSAGRKCLSQGVESFMLVRADDDLEALADPRKIYEI